MFQFEFSKENFAIISGKTTRNIMNSGFTKLNSLKNFEEQNHRSTKI